MTPRCCLSATDEEDWSNGYPIAQKFKDTYDDIVTKWRATPLPAFDAGGKFIKVHSLEDSLRGSLVLVYFELKHYAIKDKRTESVTGNTFSAIATQVTILERGADRRPSPYKSQMMKGPKYLPLSPSVKKDQISAVKAFHPGKNFLFLIYYLLIISFHHLAGPQPEMPSPSPSPIKNNKKRPNDEEGEATATEDEESGPAKGVKKRKTQGK